MKILHLSDTHAAHHRLHELPEADVVVHSGDFCMVGEEREALDFLNWFCDLPYRHKIFICGNHDSCLYGANIDGLDSNVHYLCNSGIEIEGLKFYGVPMFMEDCVTNRQTSYYTNTPADTDILITHSPAYGILDLDDSIDGEFIHYGSEEILALVMKIHPRAHLFGHIHRQHGLTKQNGIIFSNGAIMNEDYSRLNIPNIIET
ncbi:MAG: serine/threonine protein phosphatase [Bacteroides sp.]|nr:serine/threonine protein phosphatase [Bacteroides sp.]MBD5374956.1 serine/threonine protein phosphatase [Bacteroides sp.]